MKELLDFLEKHKDHSVQVFTTPGENWIDFDIHMYVDGGLVSRTFDFATIHSPAFSLTNVLEEMYNEFERSS